MNQNLAYRMRPNNISEVVGQQHLLGKNKILSRMILANRLTSMILYGAPGIGKTSIAIALAKTMKLKLESFNASKDDKKLLSLYANQARITGSPTLILVDEIHRLNKEKQDYLLSFIEKGSIIMIGATTENPYISVTPAIRSRCQIFKLEPVKSTDIIIALKRAITDSDRGLGNYSINISENDLLWIADNSGGDVRYALNSLELAVLSTNVDSKGIINLTRNDLEECMQKHTILGDKNGNNHYDVISAFQKSIRGSDTDAALHYLAAILESGDLDVACRRLYVIAFEDIDLGSYNLIPYVSSAITAAERLGLPEARIPLANAVILLSLSTKGNTGVVAIDKAIKDLYSGKDLTIPNYLTAHPDYSNKEKYKYAHDYVNDWVPQQYLPDSLTESHYLDFSNTLGEEKLSKKYALLKQKNKEYLDNNKTWKHKA